MTNSSLRYITTPGHANPSTHRFGESTSQHVEESCRCAFTSEEVIQPVVCGGSCRCPLSENPPDASLSVYISVCAYVSSTCLEPCSDMCICSVHVLSRFLTCVFVVFHFHLDPRCGSNIDSHRPRLDQRIMRRQANPFPGLCASRRIVSAGNMMSVATLQHR